MKLCIFGVALATCMVTLNALRYGKMSSPEPFSAAASGQVSESSISQILDHDDPSKGTWTQRYYVNTALWHRESPAVFLKLFGEEAATPGWLSGGAMYSWGIQFGALLFGLEHRFFGGSHPTEDTSVENLKYLTTEQALADVAEFINQMTDQYDLSPNTKWIVFGCSYAGSLAAWARLKYPNLIFGAVGSSSPLEAIVDFSQFNEVVKQSLETTHPGCGNAISNAFNTIQTMLDSDSGINSLQEKFSICGDFNPGRANDRAEFFKGLSVYTMIAVQYNGQNPPPADIATVCQHMLNESIPEPIDRFAKLRAVQGGCVPNSFDDTVAYEKESSWNDQATQENHRQWTYMTCNEFGFSLTSSSQSSAFSDTLPLSYYTDLCTAVFGENFNPEQLNAAVARTNENYKGTDIDVSRLIIVQGSIDPWHPLGMLKNPTKDTKLIYIKGGSHCQDILTPQRSDSQNIKDGRAVIENDLTQWIWYTPKN